MWVWSWGERMELKIKISAYCGIYSLAWDGWMRSLGESIDKREMLPKDWAGACSNIRRLGEEGGKKNPTKKIKEEQVISELFKMIPERLLDQNGRPEPFPFIPRFRWCNSPCIWIRIHLHTCWNQSKCHHFDKVWKAGRYLIFLFINNAQETVKRTLRDAWASCQGRWEVISPE